MRHAVAMIPAIVAFAWPSLGQTTSIVARPWRLLAFDAAFIGSVECEHAGLIAVDYRVLDAWKGAELGHHLRVEHIPQTFEPVVPYSEMGERYLLIADRSDGTPKRYVQWSLLGGEPYWWRSTGCSLSVSPWGGCRSERIRWGGGWTTFLGVGADDPSVIRDSVMAFSSLPRDYQEAIVLNQGYPRQDLFPDSVIIGSLRVGAPATATVNMILDSLLKAPGYKPELARDLAARRLGWCGGERTLAVLRSPRGIQRFGVDTSAMWHPIAMIKQRRGISHGPGGSALEVPSSPNDSLVASYRNALQGGIGVLKGSSEVEDQRRRALFLEGIRVLSVYRPELIESLLLSIDPVEVHERSDGAIYAMASYFGWRCGSKRTAHFERLLTARHPIVRTAGAIYLSFEDPSRGLAALRRAAEDLGFGGQWAAVALASRGEKDLMDRALTVFQVPQGVSIWDGHLNNLQARLAVLLSNSASASHLEAPPIWNDPMRLHDEETKDGIRWSRYFAWWSRVSDQIELSDPWLAESIRQRVD